MACHFTTPAMREWPTNSNRQSQQVARPLTRFLPHTIPPKVPAFPASRIRKPTVYPAALRLRWSRAYLRNVMFSRRPRNLPATIAYDADTQVQDVPIDRLVPEFTTVTVVGATGQIIEVRIGSRSSTLVVADEEKQAPPVRMDNGGPTVAHPEQEATLWTDVPFTVSVTDADGGLRNDFEWKARWTQPLTGVADSYHNISI